MKALKEVADEIEKLRKPTGKRDSPARTCLELAKADPTLKSGFYWVDPNAGGVSDAIRVFCKMEGDNTETCLEPQEEFSNQRWSSEKMDAQGRLWFAEVFAANNEFDYGSHKSQIKFLQHLTTFARQRIVINCKNTAIIFDNEGNNYDKAISLASFDEENMSVHSKMPFRYRVMEDGCKEKNGQWGRAVIEIRGKKARAQRVPIMDIGFLDNGADAEFGVKVGRACFS